MNRFFRLGLVVVLASGSLIHAQETPSSRTLTGATRTISGSVVLRGAVVAPVRVIIASASRTFQRTVYTDGSGSFNLSGVPYGQYSVELMAEGYLPQREFIDIPPGSGVVMVQFFMRPAPPARTPSSTAASVSVASLQIPREARHELAAGQREAQRKRWKEAREHFEKALERHPGFPQALLALALLDFRENQPEKGLERLRRATEIDPSYAEAYLGQCQVLNALGRSSEALEAGKKAATLRPDLWLVQYELGVAALSLGQDSLALEASQRIEVVAGPGIPEAKLLRAGVWLRSSRYAEAKAELVAFLRLAPEHRLAPLARKTLEEVEERLSGVPRN